MDLTRNKIKDFLNNSFSSTQYFKKVRGTVELETLKEMTIADLDFVDTLHELLQHLSTNFDNFASNTNWQPSKRQLAVLDTLTTITEDILNNEEINLKNNLYLHLFDEYYWNVYDYIDDYNNPDNQIYQEELKLLLVLLKKLLTN